jgi:putative sugar O-methyltransferase
MTPAGSARWDELTRRTLAGLETCDPAYRPTNFWQSGVHRLLDEMSDIGLEAFKTWPEAFFWFYPVYGKGITTPTIRKLVRAASAAQGDDVAGWARRALRGVHEARRDYDVACTAWDQERWPTDLEGYGESEVGRPTQTYKLGQGPALFTKPYLNYLLGLAALSRHVDEPPRRFLELGGGFGVLGEIVLARDAGAAYVDVDIPPLLTVASYYLTALFGDQRIVSYDDRVPDAGPLDLAGTSACLPSWRLPDLVGEYDVFWNSFSFQEMEPSVVANYVDVVADLGVRYVVSLNSRQGKPVGEVGEVGVREQVTSARIVSLFEARGYRLVSTYNRPLLNGAGELAVLTRG